MRRRRFNMGRRSENIGSGFPISGVVASMCVVVREIWVVDSEMSASARQYQCRHTNISGGRFNMGRGIRIWAKYSCGSPPSFQPVVQAQAGDVLKIRGVGGDERKVGEQISNLLER